MKLAVSSEVQGGTEHSTGVYTLVHEDASTVPTQQFADTVEFQKKSGSALISALFIMTLVAIAATAMSSRLQLDIYRTRLAINSDNLYLARNLVSSWAMGALSNKSSVFANKIGRGKVLELPIAAQNLVPDMIIHGSIYDLQGRFNLNNLVDKNYYPIFFKLLQTSLPDLDLQTQKNIAIAVRHWISPYVPGRGQDALFTYYLQQKPPYYPSQQDIANISEFRLIHGITAHIYLMLHGLISALPETTPINLNFAPKQLLKSLGNGLTDAEVDEILEKRREHGFIKPQDLGALLDKLHIVADTVTLESEYFLCIAQIKSQDSQLVAYFIFKRQIDKNGQLVLSLLSESLNTE